MSHLNYTIKNRKGKHLNYEERIKIEALSKIGMKSEAIAKQIGCSGRTVRRELSKSRSELLNSDLTTRIEYSADIGQQKHEYSSTNKGPILKIGNDYELVTEIERLIIEEHMSPYAAAELIKKTVVTSKQQFRIKQYITKTQLSPTSKVVGSISRFQWEL